MCILSIFSKSVDELVVTHNRDEQVERTFSDSPESAEIFGQKVTRPVDYFSGGTWIFQTEKQIGCVLNGAFKKHGKKPSYRKSRGVVTMEALQYLDFRNYVKNVDLEDIEPFTFVWIDLIRAEINLLIWDEKIKHQYHYPMKEALFLVWSSSTLYPKKRKQAHIDKLKGVLKNKESLLAAHEALKMKQGDVDPMIKTTSITQLYLNEKKLLKMNLIPKI